MSPVARPLASSEAACSPRSETGTPAVRTMKDTPDSSSVSFPGGRISRLELRHIEQEMSDLDRDVLLLVQALKLVTGNQLRRRFWPGDAAAARAGRRALARLTKWRVLDRADGRRGGVRAGSEGYIYVVGPSGHRLLAARGFHGRRRGLPGERHLAHTLAISEAIVGLHEGEASGALELIEVQTEPTCWRPFVGLMGARVILKPDAFLRIGAGQVAEDAWFLEVDMATEGSSALASKMKVYAQHFRSGEEQRRAGVYPRVIWAVPDIRRAKQLNAVLDGVEAETRRLHVVTTQAALVPLLASEARV
jgi:hypothetical protein